MNKNIHTLYAARYRDNKEHGFGKEAEICIGLREKNERLAAACHPATLLKIDDGFRLIGIDTRDDTDNFLVARGRDIYWWASIHDNTPTLYPERYICTLSEEPETTIKSGNFMVVFTSRGCEYLHFDGTEYVHLRIDDALPTLIITAGESYDITEQIGQTSFKMGYESWTRPLGSDDTETIRKRMVKAIGAIESFARASGRFIQPIVVRYAIRLFDGSMLWASAPVIIGSGVQGNAMTSAKTISSDGVFTGIEPMTISMKSYGIAITPIKGIAPQWKHLIRSVDIYYAEAKNVVNTEAIDYRCSSSTAGSTNPTFAARFITKSEAVVATELANAEEWKLMAQITDISGITEGNWHGEALAQCRDNIVEGINTLITYRRSNTEPVVDYNEFRKATTWAAVSAIPTCTTSDGNVAHLGGGSRRLVNRWSVSSMLSKKIEASEANVCTSVKINSADGERIIVSTENMPVSSLVLSPMIAVPFADATEISITIYNDGTVYSFTSPLSRSKSGEYSYCIADSLDGTEVSDTSSAFIIPAEVAPIEACSNTIVELNVGNPLTTLRSISIPGSVVAVAAARVPVSANIFGRYPLYAFADNGIFAVSTEKNAASPRKISELATTSADTISETDKGVFFIANDSLYLLRGSSAVYWTKHIGITAMAYCGVTDEIWGRKPDGTARIIQSSARHFDLPINVDFFCRQSASELYAVTSSNEVICLGRESSADVNVHYLSYPIIIGRRLSEIRWNLFGDNVDVQLTLYGENGESCHGHAINEITVKGTVNVPLHIPLLTHWFRTVRVEIEGTMSAGSSIYNVEII
ncbi:MAG: hypothetical protein ACI4A8_07630 [Muribaculaceae bacterium]